MTCSTAATAGAITNHSWDNLVTIINDEMYCQKCAIEQLEPIPLDEVLEDLANSQVNEWTRISAMPGKDLLWEGEYAGFPDFPGHTSLMQVRNSILAALEEKGMENEDLMVYPVVSHTYQFSCVLAVYLS